VPAPPVAKCRQPSYVPAESQLQDGPEGLTDIRLRLLRTQDPRDLAAQAAIAGLRVAFGEFCKRQAQFFQLSRLYRVAFTDLAF
jgi:hypothetical protein